MSIIAQIAEEGLSEEIIERLALQLVASRGDEGLPEAEANKILAMLVDMVQGAIIDLALVTGVIQGEIMVRLSEDGTELEFGITGKGQAHVEGMMEPKGPVQ